MTKLKPCPFCGKQPNIEQNNSTKKYWIHCDNPKCRIQPCGDMHTSRSVVVREWNRRSVADYEMAELEKYRHAAFIISETCVEASKGHITNNAALQIIRSQIYYGGQWKPGKEDFK